MVRKPGRELRTPEEGVRIKENASTEGRLRARPLAVDEAAPVGLQRLRSDAGRGSHLLYVPESYDGLERPAPLAVVLHGASGQASDALALLRPLAEATGIVLLAPTSRQYTWDVIVGGYGPDVEAIDGLLEEIFSRYRVDPARLAVGGFSDGASYALSLGVDNGDLFSHVLAFSPGFMAPSGQVGAPRFFVSHGTRDGVLPIDLCSRRIVPQLQRAGYEVTYKEFEGGHTVPPELARDDTDQFLSGGGRGGSCGCNAVAHGTLAEANE